MPVRIDAGFPDGETLKGLETRGIDYVARIRNNAVLDRMAQPYLRRPPGRPPREGRAWCHEPRYQADTWEHARRVVLVVEVRRAVRDGAGHRHRLESAPVARAGAASGQPGGLPWAAADVRHRPACRCRLAAAVEQAGGAGLGIRITPRPAPIVAESFPCGA